MSFSAPSQDASPPRQDASPPRQQDRRRNRSDSFEFVENIQTNGWTSIWDNNPAIAAAKLAGTMMAATAPVHVPTMAATVPVPMAAPVAPVVGVLSSSSAPPLSPETNEAPVTCKRRKIAHEGYDEIRMPFKAAAATSLATPAAMDNVEEDDYDFSDDDDDFSDDDYDFELPRLEDSSRLVSPVPEDDGILVPSLSSSAPSVTALAPYAETATSGLVVMTQASFKLKGYNNGGLKGRSSHLTHSQISDQLVPSLKKGNKCPKRIPIYGHNTTNPMYVVKDLYELDDDAPFKVKVVKTGLYLVPSDEDAFLLNRMEAIRNGPDFDTSEGNVAELFAKELAKTYCIPNIEVRVTNVLSIAVFSFAENVRSNYLTKSDGASKAEVDELRKRLEMLENSNISNPKLLTHHSHA
jgi:hypothetical protein